MRFPAQVGADPSPKLKRVRALHTAPGRATTKPWRLLSPLGSGAAARRRPSGSYRGQIIKHERAIDHPLLSDGRRRADGWRAGKAGV